MDEDKSVNQESFEKQKLEQLENELENIENKKTQEIPLQSDQLVQQPSVSQPISPALSENSKPPALGKSKGILWIGLTLLVLALVGIGAYYLGSR